MYFLKLCTGKKKKKKKKSFLRVKQFNWAIRLINNTSDNDRDKEHFNWKYCLQ